MPENFLSLRELRRNHPATAPFLVGWAEPRHHTGSRDTLRGGLAPSREQLLLALGLVGDGERFWMLEGLEVKGTCNSAPGRCVC